MVDVVCVADAAGVGSERREVCARVSRWLPLAALCVFESLVWCGQEILTLRAGRGLVGVISYSRDELSSFKRVFRRAASFLRQRSLSTPGMQLQVQHQLTVTQLACGEACSMLQSIPGPQPSTTTWFQQRTSRLSHQWLLLAAELGMVA
jgi:hypothetical protein